ncbi:aryl-alcohol dehydrogenase [Acinetobacter sp. ANC 4558]|uniref:NAD(P)-dependent alcohol dehydrogenase n=1 Tax=Acinetobacter sp. ANC 4558 TaxID=1977876 RepID=UPI000A356BEC|nr:NAD(P)-dependent alcohol dehydrogenase [Acinetobacter sp. ANC 4558]OTG87640.1 aryl-alcohol dehydrogenase [Acinetobacter sp. ANC 4558]
MKVKAAVVNGVNTNYSFESLNLAELQHDEVRVRIVATGICHSDDALRLGHAGFGFPAVLGHEGAGIVEQVGSSVNHIAKGDHVVLAYAYCSHCNHCLEGIPAACTDWLSLNWGSLRKDGSAFFTKDDGTAVSNFFHQSSFSTYTNVKVSNVIKVEKDLDLRILGPLGCGLMTGVGTIVNGLQAKPGSSIVILGTGAVGLAAMMAAKIAGCSTIIAVDIHDSRLALSKELGATHTINSKNTDVLERVREITNQVGVNYSIDTTGISDVMKLSLDVLAIRGVAAPIAVTNHDLVLNTLNDLVISSKKMIGVLMGATIPQLTIPKMIEFYKNGDFPFDKLIQFYPFEEINQASADSLSGKTIKPVLILDPNYSV